MADNQKKKKSGPSVGEILDNPGKYPEEEKRVREIASSTMDYIEHAGTGNAQDFLVQFNEENSVLVEQAKAALETASESWRSVIRAFAEYAQLPEEEAEQELKNAMSGTEYAAMRIGEFIDKSLDKDGNPIPGGPLSILSAMSGASTRIKRADMVDLPLDKVSSNVWNLLQEEDGTGQLTFRAEKIGTKKEVNIYYSIDFEALSNEGLEITKRLDPFDKRVYIAAAALFNAGNEIITLRQIHFAMGNTSAPSKNQVQKLKESISKMQFAKITLNNEEEARAGYRYGDLGYEGSLMPLEVFPYKIQGSLTDAAIRLFREPPLISFARARDQITTVPVRLLQSPVSKTNENLAIEDYLFERIARAKGKQRGSRKILFDTVFVHAKITSKKQQQRAKHKMTRYLDYYQKCGWICGYTQDAAGIEFSLPRKELSAKKVPSGDKKSRV